MRIIKLNKKQLEQLATITADIGQAVFAVTILPFIFGIDTMKPVVIVSGLLTSSTCWILSITFRK